MDWILQYKLKSNRTIYIFRKYVVDGYTPCELPNNKYIVINERTGIPFLKTKPAN